ncbi:amino acid ABC transporter permease [Amphritea sp. 1_MG-2023]|uniref:amino acid ABC transporter permease n=1 Tax=Amphritea sp. 1_MG-2023 TaxID=3062670 RepID=UPI0026E2561A|nr:amino acid ABC transporter permease [Amphritea sp. 1_MG-2023]MDO6563674.1 amino acid ABC transporter permease [Amphritea sp. 1_MG-2023]
MDLSLYVSYWPILLKGLGFTLYVCSIALLIGLIGGLLLYGLNRLGWRVTSFIYAVYLTVFRGTPLLVQVYLVYYGGPFVGLDMTAEQVGIIGLGLYVAAYFAEIYRSGFASIPPGQLEAAYDLGFSRWQVLIRIQLPQMLGLIIPPGVNQTIIMIKESAILSIITVPELTTAAISMATQSFTVIEPYLFLAVVYWLLTFAVSKTGRWCENKATGYLIRT